VQYPLYKLSIKGFEMQHTNMQVLVLLTLKNYIDPLAHLLDHFDIIYDITNLWCICRL
jgi:hypothetical protein